MAKKRPTKRKRDPLAPAKRHPRFGATEAQADRYQRERDLKNQIQALNVNLQAALAREAGTVKSLDDAHRAIVQSAPTNQRLTAMRALCGRPAIELVRAGIQHEVVTLGLWLLELDAAQSLATGKAVR